MHFKLLIALVEDTKTNAVIEAAREAGATGTTVISNASGEGMEKSKTFFGLTLETQRDVLLMLVEEHLSRHILEKISDAGEFDTQKGAGIAFQLDVEDVVGITHQIETLTEKVEDKL
jgi:nitrogen regulatory protein PII